MVVQVDVESFKSEIESELDNGKEMLEATNKAKDELESIADEIESAVDSIQKMLDDLDNINTTLEEMNSAVTRAEEVRVEI